MVVLFKLWKVDATIKKKSSINFNTFTRKHFTKNVDSYYSTED